MIRRWQRWIGGTVRHLCGAAMALDQLYPPNLQRLDRSRRWFSTATAICCRRSAADAWRLPVSIDEVDRATSDMSL
jgi:hypothetical protein